MASRRVRYAGSVEPRPFSFEFVFVIDQDESGFLGQQMAMGVKVLTIVKSLTGAAGQIPDNTVRLPLAEKVSR